MAPKFGGTLSSKLGKRSGVTGMRRSWDDQGRPSHKRMPDGGTGYHLGNGKYIARPNYKRVGGKFVRYLRPEGYSPFGTFFDPPAEIAPSEKPQTPENPGIRKEAYSTYGVSIPVSIGRRVVAGNIVDATDLIPVLIGAKTTITEFKVPVYSRGGEE